MIKIIYEDNHLLVCQKEANMLVQADNTNDLDMLSELKSYLKDKYKKPGNVYLGLVHRLDRPVGGVMVFAKTSKCASRLFKSMQDNKITKEYYAVVEGKMEKSEGTFIDYIKKDEKNNKSYISDDGKLAKLNYEVIKVVDNLSLVHITLETGRHHQIRVQFASRKHPLVGDQKYNPNEKGKTQIALWATSITFPHPVTQKMMHFTSAYPSIYPWNLFD